MTLKNIFDFGIGPSDELKKIISICEKHSNYCLIGGLALNFYVEPVFTADADFAIQSDSIDRLKTAFKDAGFKFNKNKYDIEISFKGSALKIHLTYDDQYDSFPANAIKGKLFDEFDVKIACIEDLIKGKSWAFNDPDRKLSKRTKDKLDLIRICEELPECKPLVPQSIQDEVNSNS